MDVEFARMRERLETMNLILDDIQVRFFLNKLVCNRRRQSRIANQYQEFSVYLFYVLTKLAQIQQYKIQKWSLEPDENNFHLVQGTIKKSNIINVS